jgi:hypothetical protein
VTDFDPTWDADPEDAWDVEDSLSEQFDNIDARLKWFTIEGVGPIQDDEWGLRMARVRADLRKMHNRVTAAISTLNVPGTERTSIAPPLLGPDGTPL